jgi:tyrosyl-tRNA synthetase
VLFGGDPTAASADALAVVAGEAPSVTLPDDIQNLRVHELLIEAGVAKSNSEVTRLLGQGAVRAGNRVIDTDGLLQASDLLNGGFLLLRKGKRDFVVGKTLPRG